MKDLLRSFPMTVIPLQLKPGDAAQKAGVQEQVLLMIGICTEIKEKILPVPVRTGRTRSDCRAKPVSQNQVRQREQHIQFGGLFSQTPVSRFSIQELPLYDRKYVLYFCPDR